MKSLSFVVVSLVLLGSCEAVNDLIPLPSMKATVDGEAWTSIFRGTVLDESSQTIVITGTPTANSTGDQVLILTINGTEVGEYNLVTVLVGVKAECLIAYQKTSGAENGSNDYYVSNEATITITEIDRENKKVSGTFSGYLRNTGTAMDIRVADGTFDNLSYTVNE